MTRTDLVAPPPPLFMTLLDAIILGLVEGITEYLPISSTGHLIIAAALLGLDTPELKGAVDVFAIVVQGGAILAVLGLYRARVIQMLRGLVGRDVVGLRLAINIMIAFFPAAILGVLLNDLIEEKLFFVGPVVAALALGGVWMIGLDLYHRRVVDLERLPEDATVADVGGSIDSLSPWQALAIGLFQCVAMWPGTSRSMMTIGGGVMLGLRPKAAAEFSFLLGLPTLGGACVYRLLKDVMASSAAGGEAGDAASLSMFETLGWTPILVGVGVATISAALAIKWLIHFLNRHGLAVFGVYRLILSAVMLLLVWRGVVALG
ncbi:MAG: undecaprenyl-diphosphate phosphatase [Phycisphaerales bacterium]